MTDVELGNNGKDAIERAIAGSGGGGGMTVVVFPFDQDTPGLINPSGYGAHVGDVLAGQYAEARLIASHFDQPCTLTVFLAVDSDGDDGAVQIANTTANQATNPGTVALGQLVPYNIGSTSELGTAMPDFAKVLVNCQVLFAIYPIGDLPSSFSGEIVLKIYEAS